MKKIYLLIITVCIASIALSQKNGSIKGIAYDTANHLPVNGATITLMEYKDSALVSFTLTGADGRFELAGIANGTYRLMITHVSYHNSNRKVNIDDNNKNVDLGKVVLNDKAKTLNEVVIQNEDPPVTLINDTIQYNAGSFKVQPNASVEQLLKKLPGVQVAKDGTIKAQGEKVTKVLVDGKEFFGNDPKVATKNLPADAVEKVQVYDKQSDQAQLTGFEDGNYEKTINLKLKKDKKKGLFGKINAGAGNQERYEGRFNVNSFKGARQLSAIGMGNNTNAEGFSFMDLLNFTGKLAQMQKAGGGGSININISSEDAEAMGMNAGTNSGINTAWGGGLNYNNIIGTKLDLQSNYFYNRLNPVKESDVQRRYFLPDSSYYYNQHANSNNLNNNHRLNLNLLYQIDSMNSIRIIPSYAHQQTNNPSQSNYQTLAGDKTLTNEGYSNTIANNSGYSFDNEISWRKKFARKGRTFSLSLQTSLNESNGDGQLSSINNFYHPSGSILRKDTLNQQYLTSGTVKGFVTRAVYTEPIGRRSLLELSASRSNSISTSLKNTWDFNKSSGKFDQLNSRLSNDFENTYSYSNAGIRIRKQKNNYSIAIGTTWQQSELEGKIISGHKDSVISKTFKNILPNARFQYNFSRFKNISLTYNANTNQPNIKQLQPVPDISDPLNIKEGNPGLKQEYNHNLQARLNLVSPFKNRNLFVFLTVQSTQNKIVNYDSVSSLGIKSTKPVNVNGTYNVNSNISHSRPLHFIKGTIEISANAGIYKTKQFINGAGNDIKTNSIGPDIRLDINPAEKLNIGVGAGFSYNKTNYSLQKALNTDYLSKEYNASIDWEMPKQFFFSTDFTYTVNSQRAAGFNLKVPIWNASISKQVLHYNRGEFKLSVRDLLNKNVGINRNTNNNYIEDSRVLSLRRFFLLSFTYSLSKTGLNNAGGGGTRMIIKK